jgi:hybrid cluster-associated redox disulfide protein
MRNSVVEGTIYGGDMITREMTISDIIAKHPETIEVFRAFGLDCMECQIADYEEVEHGAGVHNVDIEQLLAALNEAIKD